MPNTLFNATANPAVIAPGGQTTITVTCSVADAGQMTIGSSGSNTITAKQRALAVGQTSDSFVETINGPKGDCFLTFVFQGSGVTTVVTLQ